MRLLMNATRVFDHVVNFLAYLAGGAVGLMVLSVCAEVISRALLGRSMVWVVEMNECFLLYMTFLGTTWVLKRGAHVRIDLLLDRLNSRSQALLNCVTSTVGAMICLIVAWYGAGTTWDVSQRGVYRLTTLEFPIAPLVGIVAVGFFLLFIQFLREACGYLMSWRHSRVEEQRLRAEKGCRGRIKPDLEGKD